RVDSTLPPIVAAEDEEVRDVCQPFLAQRPARQQRSDLRFHGRRVDDDDVALLQIAFGRGAERQGTEPPQGAVRYGIGTEFSYRAASRQLTEEGRGVTAEFHIRSVRTEAIDKRGFRIGHLESLQKRCS